jgi:CDP-diacylglycerol--serine O-phosphatidyltransferase
MNRLVKRKKTEKRKRGIYLLPNVLTSASLFCGFYAILAAIDKRFYVAAISILVAGVFDTLDGRIARSTQSTSRFGLEYDSLADLISFGTAPSLMVFLWALRPCGRFGWLAAFLYVVCGALRLARFNAQAHYLDGRYFKGLPVPVAAAFVATTVLLVHHLGEPVFKHYVPILVMIYGLSFLMVSTIRYNSLKELGFFKKRPFNFLVIAVLVMIIIATEPHVTMFFVVFAYIVSGPLMHIASLWKRYVRKGAQKEFEETGVVKP